MTRTPLNRSKDLGRRAFGTTGGRETSRETPERVGEAIDLVDEILRRPIVPSVSRGWKPRAGRIYNFPLRTVPDEK